jgi:hypothetical protein
MAWKKALFLGGAVLLLAACSDATAPSTLRKVDPAATAKVLGTSSDLTPIDGAVNTLMDEECRSGYYVRSGDKDVCLVLDIQ